MSVGPDGKVRPRTLAMPADMSCAELSTALDYRMGYSPDRAETKSKSCNC